jgi:hypothetical protein
MTAIKINGIKVNTFAFDTPASVLKRYVINIGKRIVKHTVTIPQFIRFDHEPLKFEKSKEYSVSDVREEFPKTITQFLDNDIFYKLLIRYPQIDKYHLIYLFLISEGYSNLSQDEFTNAYEEHNFTSLFQQFQSGILSSAKRLYESLDSYKRAIESIFTGLEKNLKDETAYYEFFDKYEGPIAEPFTVSNITESTVLYLPDGESLYDIFDAIDVSQHLPFLMLVDRTSAGTPQKIYKIYQEFSPPSSWIFGSNLTLKDTDQNQMTLHFYISDIADVKRLWPETDNDLSAISVAGEMTEELKTLSKLYNECSWSSSNIVTMGLQGNKCAEIFCKR